MLIGTANVTYMKTINKRIIIHNIWIGKLALIRQAATSPWGEGNFS